MPTTETPLRVMFCIGVTQTFFDVPAEESAAVLPALQEAFRDLRGRFGVEVLATLDDDRLRVGEHTSSPWMAYVIADVPDVATATEVCALVRETPFGVHRLWRYARVEARIGRPLFFADR